MTLLLLGVTIGIPKAMKDKKIIYSRQYAFESRCFFYLILVSHFNIISVLSIYDVQCDFLSFVEVNSR